MIRHEIQLTDVDVENVDQRWNKSCFQSRKKKDYNANWCWMFFNSIEQVERISVLLLQTNPQHTFVRYIFLSSARTVPNKMNRAPNKNTKHIAPNNFNINSDIFCIRVLRTNKNIIRHCHWCIATHSDGDDDDDDAIHSFIPFNSIPSVLYIFYWGVQL